MIEKFNAVDDIIAAYKAGQVLRADVKLWLERRTSAAPVAPAASSELLHNLRSMLAEELCVDVSHIGLGQQFVDIGLDSMTGVNWVRKINSHYGLAINPATVYSYPSLRQFASHVAEQCKGAGADTATSAPVQAPAGRPRIAVIGMAGQFPQARDLEQFWDNLAAGRDCVTEVGSERWDMAQHFDAQRDAPGKSYSKWMGALEDAAMFDPMFFNISPREAEWMDPQQRVFLQSAWHCVEDAGYNTASLSGRACGVFVGCAAGDYAHAIPRADLNAQNFTGRAISILAAKISYVLDLQGPCVTIDTACSSSLVALASACDSLALGNCDMALAGGVCVMAGPDMHIMASRAGMLSADGRCFAFDQRANGFVPAEGVGTVLLKRVEDAERDGDHIYGVISAWGVNQDGKTSGITAPNPRAQASLVREVYQKFGIDPASIDVVEAHGTGTKLGDPIEVEALKESFGAFTGKAGYCALGSVKSNIGHTLAAAGIAGTLKLLLALRHEKIPGTVHFERLNEHIALAGTPFYINRTCKDWPAAPGRARRSAISSFGFSGTNAHLVIEEHVPQPAPAASIPAGPLAFVLSARSAQRLSLKARQLADFLARPSSAAVSLADVAATLQLGREPMEHRLAMLATTRPQLCDCLRAAAAGHDMDGVWRGHAKQGDERSQDALRAWAEAGQWPEFLAAWVQGADFDWNALYAKAAGQPRRVSLPLYPFDQKRYWLPTPAAQADAGGGQMLHPLLHQNTSTLFSGHRYSSRFTCAEFFFEQHYIKGRKVLPGVGHLEMVRAAVNDACGAHADTASLTIKNVVWMRPIVGHEGSDAAERTVIHVSLVMESEDEIAFKTFSGDDSGDQQLVIHSQGVVLPNRAVAPEQLCLDTLRAQCSDAVVDATGHFESMKERGAVLGEGFRGIEHYHLAPGLAQALSRIVIPASLAHDRGQFMLHPTAMDAAVNSVAPLMQSWEDTTGMPLALPFALEELEVLAGCQEKMWSLARPAATARGNPLKFDVDLIDDAGTVCVRFKGFSFRVIEKELGSAAKPAPALMFAPAWRDQPAGGTSQPAGRRIVVLCGCGPRTAFEAHAGAAELVCIDTPAHDANFASLAAAALDLVQKVLKERAAGQAGGSVLVQFIGTDTMLAALAGLARTLHREHGQVRAQVVLVERGDMPATIMERAAENAACAQDALVRYHAGKRQTQSWNELGTSARPAASPWKEGGVYWITGGAGALALIFAQEVLQRIERVTLILSGRSAPDEALTRRLDTLRQTARQPLTARIDYRQVDVADAAQVDAAVRSITQQHGQLNGIIHSAGVLRDNFIFSKSASELADVMAPKVQGLLHLERATQAMELDFLVLFSSIASALGNAGQADYAMANAFLDSYAADNKTARRRTVSINWPLWQEGGMTVDPQTSQRLHEATGISPLRTANGIDAFDIALASGLPQVMVLEGDNARVRDTIAALHEHAAEPKAAAPLPDIRAGTSTAAPIPIVEHTSMSQQDNKATASNDADGVLAQLKPLMAQILKIGQDDLDIDKELINYGFDSITLTEFTNTLNKQYRIPSSRALNPTVFFEFPTLRRFAGHLALEYPEMAPAAGSAKSATLQPAPAVPAPAARPVTRAPQASPGQREPIAVVGMSGRFPMATNVGQFWRNLVAERDCISEVPPERWDWREIWGDPAQPGNRTDVKWGGFIDGVAEFDPLFFGISPREALYMDPMQRLLMEQMWLAIEDAGYSARALSGTKTGIFVGTSVSDYPLVLTRAGVPNDAFMPTGRSASLGANRMSYILNLSGPSETVDTACSSSLVAIHRAVAAMEAGQCEMALVGGANIIITPDSHIAFSKAGMLSKDGRSKTFSKQANGYARGEGVGILFLKKLSAAERDGDNIYGLVRASGENHGGRASSLTAPNPKAQAELLRSVYADAGIDPRSVGFIEAHGTGTELGDPVEVNGIKMAFKELYAASGDATVTQAHCGLGSAKSNIGHLELAAGVAGSIKVLLQLKHQMLIKSLHSEEVHPYIQLKDTPFYVVRETGPWQAPRDAAGNELARTAGVSSFGFGGANAHVVFEEYRGPAEQDNAGAQDGAKRLIVLSARNEERLKDAAQQLLEAVGGGAGAMAVPLRDVDLDRIAYTLQTGREAHDERLGMEAGSLQELRDKLARFLDGQDDGAVVRGKVSRSDPALAMFDAEELKESSARWVARKQWSKLMALWVRGYEIDWHALYAGRTTPPRRIGLPGYPFARERHWPQEATTIAQPAPAAPEGLRSATFLRKQWSPAALPPAHAGLVEGSVVVLATDETMSLARRVAAQLADGRIVNLSDPAMAAVQMREFDGSAASCAGCIDLTGCGRQGAAPSDTLEWLQRVIGKQPHGRPMLLGVTRGLEACGNGAINLAGAPLAGLYRMLQSEYPKLRSRHLDADRADHDAALTRQILAELAAPGDCAEVCYRQDQRHVGSLAEFALPSGQVGARAFPADRSLLITGGTRGLGLLCAEHFVTHYGVRKLILTGREAIPARAEWARCLADNGPLARKIEALQKLERLGAVVETLSMPLGDAPALRDALQGAAASLGPIGGVLHCAGMTDLDNPAFVRKNATSFEQVLEPKQAGLDNLLAALGAAPLEFVVLFSSVSAAVPALAAGQSDYAAANAYMDYVAMAAGAGSPLVSIQWPSWKDSGMGEATSKAYRQTGLLSHTDAEGLHMLDQILAHKPGPVVLPALVERSLFKPHALMLPATGPQMPEKSPSVQAPAPVASTAPAAGTAVQWLAGMFAGELMVNPATLEPEVPFQDYGVDSIMLAQILRRVDDALTVHGKADALDPSVFYEHPTLAALAQWLAHTFPGPLAAVTGAHAPAVPASEAPPAAPAADEAPARSAAAAGDIAVIGLSCRLPGAEDLEGFWSLLTDGRSAIAAVPAERWGDGSTFHAGLLDDVTRFDPDYFLIADHDARAMDPQALLLLEQSLFALHHAGYTAKDIKGSLTGVFVGARSGHRPGAEALAQARNPILAVGQNYLASNISQFFDLRGMSMVLDTACSSALVGMNMAVRALKAGEIGAALVGGVSLLQSDEAHRLFGQRNLLSKEPQFHLFDGRASGVVLGEGAAMVMLKTVDQALRDGDQIHAVIKALAINNDGRTAGPATPSLAAQKDVMAQALRSSGRTAQDIGYIHVNGSGSEVTDLLELKAIEAVYRPAGGAPCEMGSIEPNIGHPLCAKGIAAFVQVVLMLSRRQRVPFLSGQVPMTHYDIARSPFHFGRASTGWTGEPRVAAINCFADGGTNAHAIVESWQETRAQGSVRTPLAPPVLKRRVINGKAMASTAPDANAWCREGAAGSGRLHLTADHPVLRNHQAYGQRLLPGLAYIDILYQHFEQLDFGYQELELRKLSIYQPLVVGEGIDVMLEIGCTQHADGHWLVQLEGWEQRTGARPEHKRYASAEMHRVAPAGFGETICLDEIRSTASQSHDLAVLYTQCTRQGLVHTGMIKAEGRVHETADATYVEAALGADAMAGGAAYRFHPTLIDASSVGAQRLFAAFFEGEERLLLPLYYESFRASAPLQTRCTTRIAASSLRRVNELLYMNLEFFDDAGRKVAELGNYACKLVRDEGAINPGRRQPARPAQAAPAPRASSAAMRCAAAPDAAPAERYLVELMAARVNVPAEQIDTEVGYYELGLDSARLLELVSALEAKVGASLAPTLLFEYTTIAALSAYLAQTYPAAWGISDDAPVEEAPQAPAEAVMRKPARSESNEPAVGDIAIIGMAGRYPGANSLDEFWTNLANGKDSVTEVPVERWERARLHGIKSPSGKEMSRWGGFIDHADCFDAPFFRVSPYEAKLLDPQQRHFLEVCWEAMEDAGYTPKTLVAPTGRHQRRPVGVYVGVMHNDYAILAADAVARGQTMPVSLTYAQIANRVSYFCNFHGPSMAIDTVCSSSLVAVHLAIESLRSGECKVALAGGVNLSLHPLKYLTYGLMDMHASDGRCRSFGAGGDGYVSGEGIGAVLLKPLSDAIRDNDSIYAVIKASTTNHVGSVSGLTVPSPVAQADMIEQCLDKAGVDARTISYVEAHGTGTSLGDPIEIQGLSLAFGQHTSERQFCAIGSVKSNIGHAESAAGISGLTKVALQLRHKTLVPSLHSHELNPYLDFANSPFFVQRSALAWEQPMLRQGEAQVRIPRRAALSSFGASGSNAHLILEEYEAPHVARPAHAQAVVVPLSARSAERLRVYAARMLAHVTRNAATLDLADLAYTLQAGREAMDERIALVVSDLADLGAKLQAFVSGAFAGGNGRTVFRATVPKGRKVVLPAQDDPKLMLGEWMAAGSLNKLAQAWVQGGAVDWNAVQRHLAQAVAPRRISLPTYPFVRERHWFDLPQGPLLTNAASAPALQDTLYFAPRWEVRAAAPLVAEASAPIRTTVFVVDGDGAAAQAVRKWQLAGSVVQLESGTDPAADMQRHTLQLLQYCQDAERIRRAEPELLLVYAPHFGSDYPYGALMGALRTIALEMPFMRTRLVLDAALATHDRDAMRLRLRHEIAVRDRYTEVAYPQGQDRQVLTHQVLDLPAPAGAAPLAAAVRQKGVYVITGGLGGLALMFARHIGAGSGARVVLTGRSALDDRRKAALTALEAKGVDADYVQCDSSSMDDVRRMVDYVLGKYGAINGLIHSAGVLADSFIHRKTEEQLVHVMAAKVPSIVNLDLATRALPLDFFVSFSSSAALGNAGQFDYAAANAFLDTFASHRAALVARGERQGKSLSINWPLWKEGGMAVAPAYEKIMFDKFGIVPLEEDQGVRAFASALASPEHRFGVFQGDCGRIGAIFGADGAAGTAGAKARSEPKPAPSATPAAHAGSLDTMVLGAIAQALGMEPAAIDPAVEFAQYGMDSIGATKIVAAINERLGLSLSGAILLELDSADKLLAHLREQDAVVADVMPEKAEQGSIPVNAPAPRRFAAAAIIGYDARLPGAPDADTYWQNILQKSVASGAVPRDTWKERGVAQADGKFSVFPSMRHAALIESVDGFDHGFWGMSLAQAQMMDPQERLLLQSIWHCVEHAGLSMKQLTEGRVGLFLALDSLDYQSMLRASADSTELRSAMSVGMIANQISYYCNFTGPSEAIDNACASTYVALKRAAQAIALGECDSAIVGGAKVLLDPAGFLGRDEGGILSRSGTMYPFDARAEGYVRGEGVGCVLLKGVAQAEADGDTIHAVVAGVGVTHNGKGALSEVAPSVDGQYRALRAAYEAAGVAPGSVNYIEAHGTSNSFSDASEFAAFKRYFKETMDADSYARHRCAVSTVKANIGHLEGASGMASLIKVICSLRDRKIAPTATWSTLHPSILLGNSPFHLPTDVTTWQPGAADGMSAPLRAGLHAIGIGGVNAHVVLEEYVSVPRDGTHGQPAAPGPQLVVLSARSAPALEAYCKRWHDFVLSHAGAGPALLADIAASSQLRRDAMPFRAAYVVSDLAALAEALAQGAGAIARQAIDTGAVFAAANVAGILAQDKNAGSGAAWATHDPRQAAQAWLAGQAIDWRQLKRKGSGSHVQIPVYPFDERKVWFSRTDQLQEMETSDPFADLYHETFPSTTAGEP